MQNKDKGGELPSPFPFVYLVFLLRFPCTVFRQLCFSASVAIPTLYEISMPTARYFVNQCCLRSAYAAFFNQHSSSPFSTFSTFAQFVPYLKFVYAFLRLSCFSAMLERKLILTSHCLLRLALPLQATSRIF